MKHVINCDAHFRQGATHVKCEDTALSSENMEFPFASISDGCSSSMNTDFGARLLVFSVKAYMANFWRTKIEPRAIVHDAQSTVRRAYSDPQCLDATLLVIQKIESNFRATCFGDGVVAFRKRDAGNFLIYVVSYSESAPYYLSYLADSGRHDVYMASEPVRTIKKYEFTTKEEGEWVLTPGDISEEKITPTSEVGVIFEAPVDEYDLGIVASDGMQSFVLPGEDGKLVAAPLADVFRQFFVFPRTHGQFVRARMEKALPKLAKSGCIPADDVSMGAVFVGINQDIAEEDVE